MLNKYGVNHKFLHACLALTTIFTEFVWFCLLLTVMARSRPVLTNVLSKLISRPGGNR